MAIQEGWVKELAYYCHISTLHSNKLIYNYTSRGLANLLKKSHGTVNKHVKFLIQKGLLSITKDGSLRCASKKTLRVIVVSHTSKETGKGLLIFKIHDKIKYTEWNLCSRVAINSIRQQQYIIKKKAEVNAISVKIRNNRFVTKKEISNFNKTKLHCESINDKCMLSDTSIAKQLKGRSISNVRAMISFWVKQGLISSTLIKGTVVARKVSAKQHRLMQQVDAYANTYFYKGKVVSFNQRTIELGTSIKPKEVLSNKHPKITNKYLQKLINAYSI
jgi:type I site-specific restriction endonuclease